MKLLASLFLLVPIVASAATSSELVGKWVHIRYPSMRVEISENGSNYLITEHDENRAKKYPAKFDGGMLVINAGPRPVSVDIEKRSGNLIYGGKEYRRLKSGESFEYVKKGLPKGW